MIFTETREGRRFVGEVPPGQPLLLTLRTLAANYRIGSGWIEGTGYVRDALLRRVDRDGGMGSPEVVPGTALLASLTVSVSELRGELDLVARAVVVDADGRTVAGVLDEAVSGSVELMAQTFDDITLRRFDDPATGLARWMDVGVNMVASDPEAVRSGRVALEAMTSRLLEPEQLPDLKPGDELAHPRLGSCVVTQIIDTERVSIQMESGRIAQLHLGLLTLSRAGSRHGRTVYQVSVRKRT